MIDILGNGKHLIRFIAAKLKNLKQLNSVNDKIKQLHRRTSVPPIDLKKLKTGISTLSLVDASDIPGILIQISIVVGDSAVAGSTIQSSQWQKCIYFFLCLCRSRRKEGGHIDAEVQVRYCFVVDFLLICY